MSDNNPVTIEEVQAYWWKKNIPQQWYSRREPFTLPWFNELSQKRYTLYYPYFKTEAEFEYHRGEQVLEIGCGIGRDLAEYATHGADRVSLEADITIAEGVIHKQIDIFTNEHRIDLRYTFHLQDIFPASFRTCVLTFFPDAFQRDSLQYACHNGGREKEAFLLEKDFRCGYLLSHLVSSRSAIGNTSGRFEIGDANIVITLATDPAQVAALPMIHFEDAGRDAYFLRTFYSLGEFDEASLISKERKNSEVDFSLTIIGKKNK
ncbi:MAG: hypothetical protein A3C90_00155 [Candidatus Magasanikbacteria bacterium RIFCSPHIGHO2_02_FULL_51_14]|uniref:Methyltransferase domain-containing protein n=1 Tax=Candidatus Magasanikbacteria bacterium RIFCSPHIGHO2_02_FULL_51_14 TaxID=1798683 RepID=A0A1F6MCZ0_9BACT|nr:MAG: hypothetical protein A3C90_00155 [Candidatus Magasanikbacteria bacterium RIFCSPHIGHO2_02_FULL_51_14]